MLGSNITTVHHFYVRHDDLLPACGTVPGPEGSEWHTGHALLDLLTMVDRGEACCALCLEVARSGH